MRGTPKLLLLLLSVSVSVSVSLSQLGPEFRWLLHNSACDFGVWLLERRARMM
jgi:hypothetical protein